MEKKVFQQKSYSVKCKIHQDFKYFISIYISIYIILSSETMKEKKIHFFFLLFSDYSVQLTKLNWTVHFKYNSKFKKNIFIYNVAFTFR